MGNCSFMKSNFACFVYCDGFLISSLFRILCFLLVGKAQILYWRLITWLLTCETGTIQTQPCCSTGLKLCLICTLLQCWKSAPSNSLWLVAHFPLVLTPLTACYVLCVCLLKYQIRFHYWCAWRSRTVLLGEENRGNTQWFLQVSDAAWVRVCVSACACMPKCKYVSVPSPLIAKMPPPSSSATPPPSPHLSL